MEKTNWKKVLKEEVRHLPMWYMLYGGIEVLVFMIFNYDIPGMPQHSLVEFGPIVFATVIFPLLWVIIYALCRVKINKNKQSVNIIPQLNSEEAVKNVGSA